MEAVVSRSEPLALGPVHGGLPRRFVGGHRGLPHAEGEEDVRRHVQGVDRRGSDRGVDAGRSHTEGGVHRIVVTVNQVVRGAGMLRILREDLLDHRRGLHVGRGVPMVLAGAEQGEPVEGRRVEIVRVLLVQPPHRLRIRPVALGLRALGVERLDGIQVQLFALRGRFRETPLRRRRQPVESLDGRVAVALHPERVVVRHGLAPVGHGEARVFLLGFSKRFRGVCVFETVKEQDAPEEVRHRRRRAGGRKIDPAEGAFLGRRGSRRREAENRRENRGTSANARHRTLPSQNTPSARVKKLPGRCRSRPVRSTLS